MDIPLRQIVAGAIATLLAGLIQPLLPETITDIELLVAVNHPYTQFGLILILVYAGVNWLIKKVQIHQRKKKYREMSTGLRGRSEPDRDVTIWEVKKFGVEWRVKHGRRGITSEPFARVDSAVCPECGTDLMTDTKYRVIRRDNPIWKCGGCGFTKARPQKFLRDEDQAVERMVEQRVREQSR